MKPFPERLYTELIRDKFFGVMNFHTNTGKIVDVLSKEYAIEVDFTHKWAEAIGQCLQYAYETNRSPCIVFIYDSVRDFRLLHSIRYTLKRLCITVYTIDYLTRDIYLLNV
jgi:hypothetical protein